MGTVSTQDIALETAFTPPVKVGGPLVVDVFDCSVGLAGVVEASVQKHRFYTKDKNDKGRIERTIQSVKDHLGGTIQSTVARTTMIVILLSFLFAHGSIFSLALSPKSCLPALRKTTRLSMNEFPGNEDEIVQILSKAGAAGVSFSVLRQVNGLTGRNVLWML